MVKSLLAITALTAATHAAAPLYSNASSNPAVPALATGNTASNGTVAPTGFQWSELPKDTAGFANAIAGFSAHAAGISTGFRFADDFTVPIGGWRLEQVYLYAYQSGAPATSFPFDRVTLRIWNAKPGTPGSQVIWGDLTTNRYISRAPAALFRIFSASALPLPATPDTLRPIWKITASLGNVSLAPGTYWLDWQFDNSTPTNVRALLPAATIASKRGAQNANAIQFGAQPSATWTPVLDTGKPESAADVPQDFPFILVGVAAPPACAGDINNDSHVDGRDLSVFLSAFGTAVQPGTSGDLNFSGRVDGSDLSVLLSNFGNAC